ncbi:MAG: nucleotide sugar dehydrogenase [Chloroflexota bacterium]|nr:nucleotide sugar dehydrogenase [Chloroflexota bacterium]
MSAKLQKLLLEKEAHVAVLGLGYVGLPLAVVFAEAGFTVTGIDPDTNKVDTVNGGESHIQDVSDEQVKHLVNEGKLSATSDFDVLDEADAVSICVPTPLRKTGDPDLTYILDAGSELAKHIHKDVVIVLESTTYPGTTRELLLPMLEEQSGLKIGKDFYLAFSPERVDPGREDWTTINTPKVIGGITPACGEISSTWYGQALESIVTVSSTEVAEMAKLLENTFRMINIGLVNEMAIMCNRLGVDVWEVIDAAATKPFGYMKFTPGPGLGGHCIPIDPLYLSWKLRAVNYTARFIELASEINTGMPRYVVNRIQDTLNQQGKPLKDSQILILGVAYKPDIDDIRESPALDVIGLLEQKGATVSYHDPYIKKVQHDGKEKKTVPDISEAVRGSDCVVIITNHSVYDYPVLLKMAEVSEKHTQIVDTRNALGEAGRDHPQVVRL